jgi:hypothetical protein
MKQYIENENGGYNFNGSIIPNTPEHIDRIQAEVEKGDAEIVPFDHAAKNFENKIKQLKAYREKIRCVGFSYEGHIIPSTREAQSDLSGITLSYVSGVLPEDLVTNWKVSDGKYFNIEGKAGALAFGAAMLNHIQACFSAEGVTLAQLNEDPSLDIKSAFNANLSDFMQQ